MPMRAGDFRAIPAEGGEGGPRRLPPAHFAVDAIVTPAPACQIAGEEPAQGRNQEEHVQTDIDRKSRRDRLSRHQDRPQDGNQDGRRLFRGRPRRAPCRDGRRGRLHRTAGRGRELSRHREDRRGLQEDRRGGRSSRLRLPVRARGAFRARCRRPASSSSAPIRARSPRWATRSNRRRRPRRPRSRPCPAISASSTTTSTR